MFCHSDGDPTPALTVNVRPKGETPGKYVRAMVSIDYGNFARCSGIAGAETASEHNWHFHHIEIASSHDVVY